VSGLSRSEKEARELETIRAHVRAGSNAIARGDFVEIDDINLEEYLEGLLRNKYEEPR
jgi:hypothetical protein